SARGGMAGRLDPAPPQRGGAAGGARAPRGDRTARGERRTAPPGGEAAGGGGEKLEQRVRGKALGRRRRWRYLTVDVATEEHANELAARLPDMAPAEAEVSVDANPDDIPTPVFVLLESKL